MIDSQEIIKLPITQFTAYKINEINKGIIFLQERMTYVVTDIPFVECFKMIMNGYSLIDTFKHYHNKSKKNDLQENKERFEKYLNEVFYYCKNKNAVLDNVDKEISFRFDLTHRCNLSCKHCLIDDYSVLKEIDINGWNLILNKIKSQLSNVKRICLSGGEPFIHENFYELVRRIKKCGFQLVVMTNGIVLYELIHNNDLNRLNFILDHIDHFQISFDGYDSKNMDYIRGIGTFDKVLTVIKYLCQNHKNIVEVHTTVSEANLENLENNFINFLKKYDLFKRDKVHYSFSMVRDLGRAKNLVLTDNVRFELFLYHLYKQISQEYSICNSKEFPRHFSNCGIGSPIAVSPNGDMWMCGIPGTEMFGNIFEQNFDATLDKIHKTRQMTMLYNMDFCKDCLLKGYCNGHCRILNKKYTGQYTIPPCNEMLKKSICVSLIRKREFGNIL